VPRFPPPPNFLAQGIDPIHCVPLFSPVIDFLEATVTTFPPEHFADSSGAWISLRVLLAVHFTLEAYPFRPTSPDQNRESLFLFCLTLKMEVSYNSDFLPALISPRSIFLAGSLVAVYSL